MKLVINSCYGGFSVSKECAKFMAKLGSQAAKNALKTEKKHWYGFFAEENRADPALVNAVEKLGKKASGELAELVIVEIPDGVDWVIDDYDGIESVHERHRVWS